MTGGADHQGLGALAGAEQVDRRLGAARSKLLRELAGGLGRHQEQGDSVIDDQVS
jgi:hypothetical protein